MLYGRPKLEGALDRWVEQGLLSETAAVPLREDARRQASRRRRRIVQHAMAATGALVLSFAAVLFVREVWESLGAAVQSVVIGAGGALLLAGGCVLERRARGASGAGPGDAAGVLAAAYGLQAGGLGVLLVASIYSHSAWPSGTGGGRVVAGLTVLLPLVAFAFVRLRSRVMPAVVMVASYAFLAAALDRFFESPPADVVWVLDGYFVLMTVALVAGIRAKASQGVPARGLDALFAAFTGHLFVGFPLVIATGFGPLELDGVTWFLVDGWWVLVTGVILWAVHAAPGVVRRRWMERLVPLTVLLATVLAFPTVLAGLDGGAAGAALLVAGLGLGALGYGLRVGIPGVVEAGCFALLVAAWSYTGSQASPLAGALALVGTAALLFWLVRRTDVGATDAGHEPDHPDRAE